MASVRTLAIGTKTMALVKHTGPWHEMPVGCVGVNPRTIETNRIYIWVRTATTSEFWGGPEDSGGNYTVDKQYELCWYINGRLNADSMNYGDFELTWYTNEEEAMPF